jgi:hypothetical protein
MTYNNEFMKFPRYETRLLKFARITIALKYNAHAHNEKKEGKR